MTKKVHGFDIEEEIESEVVVSKIDAARFQIDAAVTMFFQEWDVISQYTLIGAAHGILYDLAKPKGIDHSIKDSPLIKPERRGEFLKAISIPQNYFKHADRDRDTRLKFKYKFTKFYMFDAIQLFMLLTNDVTPKMKIYLMWFQLRYPDLLCVTSIEDDLEKIREGVTDPNIYMAIGKKLIDKL